MSTKPGNVLFWMAGIALAIIPRMFLRETGHAGPQS
jgi:hypothetical protein